MPAPTSREYHNTCLEWPAAKDSYGYGIKSFQGRSRPTHRVAYCIANNLDYKQIRGLLIRHKCDNPACVNPEHLEPGNHADNSADMVRRGRSMQGERHYGNVLTEQIVIEAKKLHIKYHPEFSIPALAKHYGVNKQTLANAVSGNTWSYLK